MKNNKKPYILLFLVVGIISLFTISYIKKNGNNFNGFNDQNLGARDKSFEQQIKFSVDKKETLELISNARKILSYEVKSIGKYDYQDYYFDSPDYDIAKLGCSYRFRVADKGNNKNVEYRIQFKKEYDAENKESFVRTEIDIAIPADIAKNLLAGNFKRIFSDNLNNEKVKELNSFLVSQKIDINSLLPIIYGRQFRDRHRFKENKITFFEISLDEAYFKDLRDENKEISFMEMEFENKYTGGYRGEQTGFINERINKLINFFSEKYKIKITKDSKYKKVVDAFKM